MDGTTRLDRYDRYRIVGRLEIQKESDGGRVSNDQVHRDRTWRDATRQSGLLVRIHEEWLMYRVWLV